MIFNKESLDARAAVISQHREQLEACNVGFWLTTDVSSHMGFHTSHLQEYQQNITDAEGIYMAHDRRHPDANQYCVPNLLRRPQAISLVRQSGREEESGEARGKEEERRIQQRGKGRNGS